MGSIRLAAPAQSDARPSLEELMRLTSPLLLLLTAPITALPGLALFYGGMVRKMNVLATVMQSFAITCLVTVLWAVVGYSIAFTEGNPFSGGMSRFLLKGMT